MTAGRRLPQLPPRRVTTAEVDAFLEAMSAEQVHRLARRLRGVERAVASGAFKPAGSVSSGTSNRPGHPGPGTTAPTSASAHKETD